MVKVAGRMQHRELAGAVASWHWVMAEKARRERLVRKALMTVLQRAMAGAFRGWCGSVADKRKQRHIVNKTVQKMLHREIASAAAK